jgi:prolyl-tRNA synthetase
LYDDREASAGEKFAEADLIGISRRLIVSGKSLAAGGYELGWRKNKETKIVSLEQLIADLSSK